MKRETHILMEPKCISHSISYKTSIQLKLLKQRERDREREHDDLKYFFHSFMMMKQFPKFEYFCNSNLLSLVLLAAVFFIKTETSETRDFIITLLLVCFYSMTFFMQSYSFFDFILWFWSDLVHNLIDYSQIIKHHSWMGFSSCILRMWTIF